MTSAAWLRKTMQQLASAERLYPGVRPLLPVALRRTLRRAMGLVREPSPRRYIPAALGVRGFFGELRDRDVAYVVMRWFELLPEIAPGEDIDLLVADGDMPAMTALLDEEVGLTPCDVYTVTGLPGTDYRRMAYYPPSLACRILDRSVLIDGLYRVPCPEDHFLSLAFHALYHKGIAAGLPSTIMGMVSASPPEHDYTASLAKLAAALQWKVEITMEALDQMLTEHGWRPPQDMLEQLAEHNLWIRHRFFTEPAAPA